MGALCKHSPSVGGQRKLLIHALNLEGLKSPRPGAELLLTAMALLTCSLHPSMLSSGWDKGSRLGHGDVPGMSALMCRAGAAPSISWLPMASLLGQDAPVVAGERKSSREVIFCPIRGGWERTAGSDSTANPHSLVPRGFLTSQHHPQHSVTLTVSHSTSPPSAVSPFRRIKQLIS